ncbi:hypothetical protein AOLI_G00126750 [Acnodon oligacanthus]
MGDEDKDVDGVEVDFVEVTVVLDEDDGLQPSDENIVKLGLDYIKDHLVEEASNQLLVDGSSASDDEDFFASMKPTHGQEGIKQLDGYLACKVDDKEILSFPAVVFEGQY